MALAAATVWEIRTAGNDANGGAFVTGSSGADYSQQDSKRTGTGTDDSTTDVVANGTTTLTSATANFGTSIVGNVICLSGGTGSLTKGWYQVTARTNATTITLDRTVAAGTGITMNIGGALASLGMCGGAGLVNGHRIYIKAGTYTVTTSSVNVTNGCFSRAGNIYIEGYDAARGDFGTRPLIQASGITSFELININTAASNAVANLRLDGASAVSSRGIALGGIAYRVHGSNFRNSAFAPQGGATAICVDCSATGCATQPAFINCWGFGCVAFSNTIHGFRVTGGAQSFVRCVAYSNSGASIEGFVVDGGSVMFANCIAYGNGRDGFRYNTNLTGTFVNCISEANGGTGFNAASFNGAIFRNCAAYNNTTANFNMGTGVNYNLGPITGAGSFFTNAAAADFSLNDTAGAGALLRATGVPGTLLGLATSTGYLDIGAFQHQDGGGGGGSTEHAYVFVG